MSGYVAIINENVRLDGSLSFSGDTKIGGVITGTIVCSGDLVITETAKVFADIKAKSVKLSGIVKGDIKATHLVEMRKPARFEGAVSTPSLSVENGVIFHGKSSID